MTKFQEHMANIAKGIEPPNSFNINDGGENSCDCCGGTVTWPTTGEPCQGVCDNGCSFKLYDAWHKYISNSN